MKRIGITQRIDEIADRREWRDALDVRIGRLIFSLGYLPVPLCSAVESPERYLEALALDGFVLSGGNDIGSALSRDRLETAVLYYAYVHRLPVLGICRGMQFMNVHLGGRLDPLQGHVCTRHAIQGRLAPHGREVNSFHWLGIWPQALAKALEPLAQAADGSVEALRHRDLPWLGIMWHPERDTPTEPQDLDLIRAHFGPSLCGSSAASMQRQIENRTPEKDKR